MIRDQRDVISRIVIVIKTRIRELVQVFFSSHRVDLWMGRRFIRALLISIDNSKRDVSWILKGVKVKLNSLRYRHIMEIRTEIVQNNNKESR